MTRFQNTASPAVTGWTAQGQTSWADEINTVAGMPMGGDMAAMEAAPGAAGAMGRPGVINVTGQPMAQGGQMQNTLPAGMAGQPMTQGSQLQMQNNLPADVIEAPTSREEAYLGSLKAMLSRNIGNYIVATFLVGTQNMVTWEGILYDVGNDYLTIYQESRDRYIVSDYYSLKFMEFYDTERRKLCDSILQENGWGPARS